ncbi:aldose 1-epimerase family protein [Weissella coleopterorum]|uniref:Aldose 1-epimerase family protein n=1 Tax=Weissella coleopterorum TaxID=2714949 RepID=A0A6G8B1R5_9LACO|nr:aldose 1-epimerase family protein [Weissella coleopterorum]QIL51177.1 aldose 1-epimerase family protein [Weissella coleopterorum]
MLVIENNDLKVEINQLGAEITHIWNKKENFDYIWNGDIWPKHAPVLFPSIGRSAEDQYSYDGKIYNMPQHGFAQEQMFTVDNKSSEVLILELTDNDETQKLFPFKFSLKIEFRLNKNQLFINFKISNLDKKEFSYSIGAHPALNVPINGLGSFSDYQLSFEPVVEELKQFEIIKTPNPYRTGNLIPVSAYSDGVINLNYDMFEAGLVILENKDLDKIILHSGVTKHQIEINIKDFRYLCLWTKEGANAEFLCIEPFQGLPDIDRHVSDLLNKEANVKIGVGEENSLGYSLKFE